MKAHELLGVIMVREGILNRDQLALALEKQRALRQAGQMQPLGMIVIELGFASEAQIRHAIRLQKKLAWAPDTAVPLGVKLVSGGVLAPSLLVSLLDEQARTGEPLESLLVERQIVQPVVIAHFRDQAVE